MSQKRGAPRGAPFFVIIAALIPMAFFAACAKPGKFSVLSTLRTGAQPEGMALSQDGSMLAVACQRSNDVWIHNLKSMAISRVDTLPAPEDVLFDDDGKRLLVSESGGDSVAQISLDEMRITRRFNVLPQPRRMMRFRDGQRILVSSLSLTGAGVFRLPALRAEKMLNMEGFTQRILQSTDGKELFAVTRQSPAFVSFRIADLSQQLSVLVKGSPVDLALSDDGHFAWVAGEGKFFDPDDDPGKESEPGAITCVRLSDGRAVDWGPSCAAIRAITLSKSGRWLYAACGEEGELQVIDLETFEVMAKLDLPGNPSQLLLSPDGRRLYVAQSDLKQISVVQCGPWQ